MNELTLTAPDIGYALGGADTVCIKAVLPQNKVQSFTAIILAGKRRGTDPVAAHAGTLSKAHVPLHGKPMIRYVMDALCQSGAVKTIVVVGDDAVQMAHDITLCQQQYPSVQCVFMGAGVGISGSLKSVMNRFGKVNPYLVTTADNPLLTPATVAEFIGGADKDAALAIGFVDQNTIEAAYPASKRTYLKFQDKSVSGANLFIMKAGQVEPALDFWQALEQNRKKPWQMIKAFGPKVLLGMLFQKLSLQHAFEAAGKIAGCSVSAYCLSSAEAAMDVDSVSDYYISETILMTRMKEQATSPVTAFCPLAGEQRNPCLHAIDARNHIAVFDLDRTITRGGTFTPFLLSTRKTLWGKAALFAKLFRHMISYRMGHISRTELKSRMLAVALKGQTEAGITKHADSYVKYTLDYNVRKECINAIKQHKITGNRLVLATASIDIYATLFARYLGFDEVICTETAFVGSRDTLTLKGENCYNVEKAKRVIDALLAGGNRQRADVFVSFYSDHHTDMALLDWADRPFVVSPDLKTYALAVIRQMKIVNW
ncbi:HAD-IB family hydrolase [Kordiimonas pumila]|uniref:HAD-IB family hydrolase n=1 Tax=Kordiimonas pumila TaxID=2161677 RepID=A0ABV7D6M4_9PROT|nr:HAD-IB family hydrolase [Kordiimonas pumila]